MGIVGIFHVGLFLLLVIPSGCQTSEQAVSPAQEPRQNGDQKAANADEKAAAESPKQAQATAVDVDAIRATPRRPAQTAAEQALTGQAITTQTVMKTTNGDQLSRQATNKIAGEGLLATASKIYIVRNGDTLAKIARRTGTKLQNLLQANHLTRQSMIRKGQKLIVPLSSPSPSDRTFQALDIQKSSVYPNFTASYRVRPGDSLSKIAVKGRISGRQLKAANSLTGDTLRVGQTLKVPPSAVAALRRATHHHAHKAKQHVHSQGVSSLGEGTYIVSRGETLATIAKKWGVSVNQLKKWNHISHARNLREGRKLIVSEGVAKTSAVSSEQTASGSAEGISQDLANPSVVDASLQGEANAAASSGETNPASTPSLAPSHEAPVNPQPAVPQGPESEKVLEEADALFNLTEEAPTVPVEDAQKNAQH